MAARRPAHPAGTVTGEKNPNGAGFGPGARGPLTPALSPWGERETDGTAILPARSGSRSPRGRGKGCQGRAFGPSRGVDAAPTVGGQKSEDRGQEKPCLLSSVHLSLTQARPAA
ncbi:hypothetical protein JCM30394_11440 [Deferrisoma palaeochoriense]